ncbi:hypothetical protein GCM10029976_009950 [Kribbella albertanoniae]
MLVRPVRVFWTVLEAWTTVGSALHLEVDEMQMVYLPVPPRLEALLRPRRRTMHVGQTYPLPAVKYIGRLLRFQLQVRGQRLHAAWCAAPVIHPSPPPQPTRSASDYQDLVEKAGFPGRAESVRPPLPSRSGRR